MRAPFSAFKRILVPVDFSIRSANALRYAVALGSLKQAEIDVLHVWHSDLATQVTVARDRAKSELCDFVSGLALRGDVELRRLTDHGDACFTIQRTAQLAGYDLVVVAGPEPGADDAGSVARRLLRSVSVPVLFVPAHCRAPLRSEHESVLHLSRILVPLALAGAELAALDCACTLGDASAARVEALLTSDTLQAQLEHWRARPQAERLAAFEQAEGSELAAPRRTQSAHFDLLVMSGKRASIGERAIDVRPERVALSVLCASLSLPEG
ncbi:MAG TPA: universal stress protein [Polyangiaceae bacterium]|nr:universal stress protein [Polyangiaceae bacterium]